MGYLIKNIDGIKIYKTVIENKDLLTMGSIPINLNCYNNSNFNNNGIVFIPIAASIQNYLATTPFTTGVSATDHLIISANPGFYFFWKNNILATTDNFIYTSNYIQTTHNLSGNIYTGNVEPDKLNGIVTFTNTTGANPTGGDGGLIVNIAGYFANFN